QRLQRDECEIAHISLRPVSIFYRQDAGSRGQRDETTHSQFEFAAAYFATSLGSPEAQQASPAGMGGCHANLGAVRRMAHFSACAYRHRLGPLQLAANEPLGHDLRAVLRRTDDILPVDRGAVAADHRRGQPQLGKARPAGATRTRATRPIDGGLCTRGGAAFHLGRRMDKAARELCMRLAAIPREAAWLALELAQTVDFQPRSELLRNKVSKIITEDISAQALRFEADGSPASRFTRAVGLYWLFVGPN